MKIYNQQNLNRASGFLIKKISTVYNNGKFTDPSIKKKIGHLIENAMTYIYFHDGSYQYNPIQQTEKYKTCVLDMPSKTIHIEVGDGVVGRIGSANQIKHNELVVHSFIVHEVAPGNYEFLVFANGNSLYHFTIGSPQYGAMVMNADLFIKRQQQFKIGVKEVTDTILIQKPQEKIKKEIGMVVYVHPREWEADHPSLGDNIDYSHRFCVRGHWRKCAFIGKDREGNYTVTGYTWVSEHIRGPEDKPLVVNKIRVVDEITAMGNLMVVSC